MLSTFIFFSLVYIKVHSSPLVRNRKVLNDGRKRNQKVNKVSHIPVPTQNDTYVSFNLSVITWNLAETIPTAKDCEFLLQFKQEDIVVIGVQEVEDIKPRRHEGRRSRAWKLLIDGILGKNMECLTIHKMGGIQIAVFAKKSILSKIKGIQTLEVACGVGNVLTNKGAVCVLLKVRGKTIAFVNSHLAAHQKKVSERNSDYWRILDSIVEKTNRHSALGTPSAAKGREFIKKGRGNSRNARRSAVRKSTTSTWLDQLWEKSDRGTLETPNSDQQASQATTERLWPFDCTVFFGDLNYRLNLPRLEVELFKAAAETCVDGMEVGVAAQRDLQALLEYDQLIAQRATGRAFVGLREGPIGFMPTFKYNKGSPEFDSSAKKRLPSWTDRILFSAKKSAAGRSGDSSSQSITLRRYTSVDVRHSDHRPVYAQFVVTL